MSKSQNVAVMDIGTSKVSVFIGCRGINDTLKVAGFFEAEYSGYYNGEFVEPDKLNDDISGALSKAEINAGESIKKIFVGVPADFSIIKNKTFVQNFGERRKISENDILDIYEKVNELKDNTNYVLISCSPVYFVLDDGRKVLNPVGEKSTRISGEISYIYAETPFISKINVALRSFGICVVEYLSATLATDTYIVSQEKRDVPCIVVDCGFISTSVSIVHGNGLKLLSSFSVGGGQVTSDLSECLKISYKEAEEIKKQIVLSVVPALGDGYEIHRDTNVVPIPMQQANEIVFARLDMICSLINKCLTSVNKAELYKMPFYLTGGGICFIKGARDYLSKTFGVNIEILSPPSLQYTKPSFSAGLGLLNMAITQEQKHKTNIILKILKRITKR